MRGGGFRAGYHRERQVGRSPHARGRPAHITSGSQKSGSIPACAGEAERFIAAPEQNEVDPRMRGGGGPSTVWAINLRIPVKPATQTT